MQQKEHQLEGAKGGEEDPLESGNSYHYSDESVGGRGCPSEVIKVEEKKEQNLA